MPRNSCEEKPRPLSRPGSVLLGAAMLTLVAGTYIAVDSQPSGKPLKSHTVPLPKLDYHSAESLVRNATPASTPNRIELACPADHPAAERPVSVPLVAGQTEQIEVTTTDATGQVIATKSGRARVETWLADHTLHESVLLSLHNSQPPTSKVITWDLYQVSPYSVLTDFPTVQEDGNVLFAAAPTASRRQFSLAVACKP